MDTGSFVLLMFFCGVAVGGIGIAVSVARAKKSQDFLAANGVSLDYRLGNMLGVSRAAEKVYVYPFSGRPMLIDVGDVRSVTKNSILQTKSNAWGMQFHKEKHCKLTIQTNSLERPEVTMSFSNPKDLNLWHARLSTFCNLS